MGRQIIRSAVPRSKLLASLPALAVVGRWRVKVALCCIPVRGGFSVLLPIVLSAFGAGFTKYKGRGHARNAEVMRSSPNLFDFIETHEHGRIVLFKPAVAANEICQWRYVGVLFVIQIECDKNHYVSGEIGNLSLPIAALTQQFERPLVLFQVILHIALPDS